MQEIIVDSFAGGGGASLGIAMALGRSPDVAINHDADAIAVHVANHPDCLHFTEKVWKVNPRDATQGRDVGLLWASPDCKHFSQAKGGKPVEKKIRSLAWVVVRWILEARPRVIILENVREFEGWGPIVPAWFCGRCKWRGTEGQAVMLQKARRCPSCGAARLKLTADLIPDPRRKGLTFKKFVGRIRNLGYAVAWKVLNAADYGAPTKRRRLFLIARCDGRPIVWPEPTHADPLKAVEPCLFGQLPPWRTAAECIDWTLPCPSIFDRKKPLVEATLRRIAHGIKRYVLDSPKPFIVQCNHGNDEFRGQALDEPLGTLTAIRAHGLVAPVLARLGQQGGNGGYANSAMAPLTTLTSKAEHLLVSPSLVQVGYGERPGQTPRVLDLHAPLGTAVGTDKVALVSAFIVKHFGERQGSPPGSPADSPMPTVMPRGTQTQLVAANLVHLNHGDKQWSAPDEPMRSLTTGKHAALVYAFLTKYYGTAVGSSLHDPMPTATQGDRFGLVTVTVDGAVYAIVDIGMRMLEPRELARCQSFPDSYQLPSDPLPGSRTSAVAMIGNSVPPAIAEQLVRANYEARVPCTS